MTPPDDTWPMIEQAVFHLFAGLTESGPDPAMPMYLQLAELGWAAIEVEYPIEAWELLFRAQGRFLTQTDSLTRVMLDELGVASLPPVDGIVLPDLGDGTAPSSRPGSVSGLVLGVPSGSLAVPVMSASGQVLMGVLDAADLRCVRLDTFDSSVIWTHVSGAIDVEVGAPIPWTDAVAVAHRALGTELVALSDQMLQIAIQHVSARNQFGAPLGSFQAPRHALADAAADIDGARALLDETWRYGGDFSALAAKAVAGRAHRHCAEVALQVCGALGLTQEHDLHRYVRRGFQIDALLGSHQQLETLVADRLFGAPCVDRPLPTVVSWR